MYERSWCADTSRAPHDEVSMHQKKWLNTSLAAVSIARIAIKIEARLPMMMPLDQLQITTARPVCDCRVDQRGFTLVELIMVIVIMGVLAVFAASRLFNNADNTYVEAGIGYVHERSLPPSI